MAVNQQDVFVFIGPPGSGKGSLSSLCVYQLGWKQVATGNLCRKHIAQKTPIGQEIDAAIQAGNSISDSLITRMVKEQFAQMEEDDYTIILDGYPRTIVQAQEFNNLLQGPLGELKLHVVKIDVSDQCVIDRLVNRFICKNNECQAVYSKASGSTLAPKKDGICDVCSHELIRRSDDTLEAVKDRLKVYHRHETGLLEYYRSIGQDIICIDGETSLNRVFENFRALMGLSDT